jgi:hypothetical protein
MIRKPGNRRRNSRMARFLFYMTCETNDKEGVRSYLESSVKEHGGLEVLEEELRRSTKWFSFIGASEAPTSILSPGQPGFPHGSIAAMVEAWVEKGAPKTNGVAGVRTRHKFFGRKSAVSRIRLASSNRLQEAQRGNQATRFTRRYLIYKSRNQNGDESIFAQDEAEVLEHGGTAALESLIYANTAWFYLLGVLEFPAWVRKESGIQIPHRRVKALVDRWIEAGSPWKPGKFAEDINAPPKGHPIE